MVGRILAVLSLGLLAAPLAGAACTIVKRVQQVQVVPVAQAILVPAYGGSYQPGPQVDPDLLRRLVEAVERLAARLEAPAGGHTLESVSKQSCAKCHTEGNRPEAGFALFDKQGQMLELSLGDKRAIRARITSRDPQQVMPPGKPLDPARQSAMLQALKQ